MGSYLVKSLDWHFPDFMGLLVEQPLTFQNWVKAKRNMSGLKWANTKFAFHVEALGTKGDTKTKGRVPNTSHPNGIMFLRLTEVQAHFFLSWLWSK